MRPLPDEAVSQMRQAIQWNILRFKKGGHSNVCDHMGDPWGQWREGKQARHKKINTVWLHLYEVPRVLKFIKVDSRMLVSQG